LSKLNWHSIKAWWFDPTTKRLGYAVLLSTLLHFLFIEQSGWVTLSKFPSPFQSIDAELVALPPHPVAAQQQSETALNEQAQAEPAVKELPEAVTENVAEPVPESTTYAPASSEPLVDEAVVVESSQEVIAPEAASAEAEQALTLPDTTADVKKPQPFTMVETDFDVLVNHSPERVGTAKIRYAKSNDQRYELTWSVSLTGLISLVYPDLLQTSQGKVTEAGLLPDYYLYKFGAREEKSYQASFNWVDKEVALQSTKGTKKVPIADNVKAGHIQDFLSFMYQFMFAPPLEDMQMYLTNGRKLSLYDYGFEGEELLELKFGTINTYHIQHAKADSEDKTELWLAMDHQYVPVKIRKTEKDGTVIEQIATRLKFETIENETPLP